PRGRARLDPEAPEERRRPVSEGPSIAERYHDETKYTPEKIAGSNRQLDWDKKPELWKDYAGHEGVSLAPHLGLKGPSLAEALKGLPLGSLLADKLTRQHLARLLFFTNGVTRVVP